MLKTFIILSLTSILFFFGCRHDPIDPDPPDPMPPKDTVHVSDPCASNVIHYQTDIRPILFNNCAVSGCHDKETAQNGIILNDFENTLASGGIVPFYLDSSSIYQRIRSTGPIKMPPDPRSSLEPEQINLIKNWILQGAEDYLCDTIPFCDTLDVSYVQHIFPIFARSCRGCHSGTNPAAGVSLTNYDEISLIGQSGRLVGVVAWWFGFAKMPPNGNKLPECEIEQIRRWVAAGVPDN